MRFAATVVTLFAAIGMTSAAVTPRDQTLDVRSESLLFNKRACDCAGIQNCCMDCLSNGGGEACCNGHCMDIFPGCYNAC